ncbi:F0F1 ATP synthase subunit delta [Saccharomonospora saliphila]|uniref:F0F1 ATP synthase subunit delta n=1 Tax=Saccharomonospora saliphila TaxID=369829 RepID=UPI00035F4CD4|nr:F0F1 ATP synthase subunit delta [Saccharomonospora saliphila]
MTLHAASREALSFAESRLDEVLGDAGSAPSAVGEELLAVVELLTTEVGLRRAVSDGSSDPEARTRLIGALLRDKVSAPTLTVLEAVVGQRWSSPRELVDGVEHLGRTALLVGAENAGKLDAVEDELFRFARILDGKPELEKALAERSASAEAKRGLVRQLVADKVDPITKVLVEQVVLRPSGRSVTHGVDGLVEMAARRRGRVVARVTSAGELSAEQRERLAARLGALYDSPVALHVELDASLGAGLVVRVGDEVIDGSAAGRLEAVRRQLAG